MYKLMLPACIISGIDSIRNLKSIIEKEAVSRIVIFTDKGVADSGLLKQICDCLIDLCISIRIFDNVNSEPEYEHVQELICKCREINPDFIIALGGGSVMDTAKLASLLIKSPFNVKDLFSDPTVAGKSIKSLMIPTTAGTGSEATPNAIVAVPEEELKVGIVNQSMIPDYVILDPAMIKSIPRRIAASTGLDALCHAIECFTGNKANQFSDTFALEALSMIFENIEESVDNPSAIVAKEKMLIASFYAGVAIASSGTTAVHALSYPLGGKYHIAHGISNAMLLLPVMKFNEDAIRHRLALVYDRCFGAKRISRKAKSQAVMERLELIIKHLEIPRSLADFGISSKDLDNLVGAAMKVTRLLSNNAKEVTAADVAAIYQEII